MRMLFQVAKLIHFATKDIMTDGDFIKVGGSPCLLSSHSDLSSF